MPYYDFTCMSCDIEFERRTTVEFRDMVTCHQCGNHAIRNITFNGTVWAPTSTGGGHK